MTTDTASLADRRRLVAGCADALRDLRTVLYQCGSEDLAGLAGDLASSAPWPGPPW